MKGTRYEGEVIREWKEEAGLNNLDYVVRVYHTRHNDVLTIMTSRPSYLIGRCGILGNKYRDILKKECGLKKINIYELSSWE